MTAYTSTQSGLFSANSTWGGGGHPSVNGDTFVVSSGHSVEYDVDNSGLANGFAASTVNGTLFFSRTAGSYILKLSATLTISTTGTLDASNGSGGAYPSNCTAQITTAANITLITVAGSGVVNLVAGQPTHYYAKLTADAASSATVLSIDTDLTVAGDTGLWANPSLVRVDNVNRAAQSEQYTISSKSATTLTLTTGLTNAKSTGAVIILVTRNVKLVQTGILQGMGVSGSTNGVFGGEIRGFVTGITGATTPTISGTITGCTNSLAASTSPVVSGAMSGGTTAINGGYVLSATGVVSGGGVSHIVSGVISGFSAAAFLTAVGVVFSGLISGCLRGFSSSSSAINNGIITGCDSGINNSLGCINNGTISNCNLGATFASGLVNAGSITGCATGITQSYGIRLKSGSLSVNSVADLGTLITGESDNTLFGSTTEFSGYASVYRGITDYMESIDHDQVAGAFRAWCKGGIVTSVASPVYDGTRVRSYQHACESASAYVFRQQQIWIPAFGSVNVRCYARKDASMSYLPRLWIFPASAEPFISGSPTVEAIMTNSVDTWEVLTGVVTNTTNAPQPYIVRTLASATSGNAYFDPIIRTSAMLFPANVEGGLVA